LDIYGLVFGFLTLNWIHLRGLPFSRVSVFKGIFILSGEEKQQL
jgi:hypothetical protein